jgi:transposase
MKVSARRRAYDRNAVRSRAIVAIANASREFSQSRGGGDFGKGEFLRLDDDVVVAETMKLYELWRHYSKLI